MPDNPYLQFTPGAGAEAPPPAPSDNPYLQFKDTSEPARITVRPENRAAAALNIPEAYQGLVRSGLGSVAQGAENVGAGVEAFSAPDVGRSARGPVPISARLKAVGDILGGLGKTVGGAIEYGTAPLMAPVRAIATQPIENVLGIPREYTEFAAGMAAPVPKALNVPGMGKRAVAPSVAELKAEASAGYNAPEVTGFMAQPTAAPRLAEELRLDLAKGRVSDVTAPGVFKLVDKIETPPPGAVGFSADNLENLRQQLGDVATPIKDGTGKVINAAEIRAAGIARDRIDQFLREMPQSEVLAGEPKAAAAKLEEARANSSAAFSAETINRKEFVAELRAAAANSGHNIGNTLRSRIADILINPEARRGFSQTELAMMERIVRGTAVENRVREASNVLGGGGGAHAFYSGVLTLGVAPLIGSGLKKLSNVITAKNIDKLNEMVRADSPLGRKIGAPMQDWSAASQSFQVSPTARNIARLTISSRNLSNNLRDVGINVIPDDLLRAATTPSSDSQNSE